MQLIPWKTPRLGRCALAGRTAMLFFLVVTLAGSIAVAPAGAKVLDFGAAIQDLRVGKEVECVRAGERGWMRVCVTNYGGGPDLCIVFDSDDPTGGDDDLGTPNEDFDGPGDGRGGEAGGLGPNAVELGKLLIIAESGRDADHDGLVDEPDDESGGGTISLTFSHAGRLSFTLVDVDCDEEEPRFFLYHEGDLVDVVEGESLGDNSASQVDLAGYGDIDKVKIALDGSAGLGAIRLEVLQVGVEPSTWSTVKGMFR